MSYVKGKVALITGGSRGIGFEFAKALMKHGVKVRKLSTLIRY